MHKEGRTRTEPACKEVGSHDAWKKSDRLLGREDRS